MKLSFSKPFCIIFNYGSTANIEEVMKFYNLGDKTFETDFSFLYQGGEGLSRSAKGFSSILLDNIPSENEFWLINLL